MPNGRIPKYMLYGELVTGTRTATRPCLRYRDTCKRDIKVAGIDTTTLEAAADDRGNWRSVVKAVIRRGDEKGYAHVADIGRRGNKSIPTLHTLLNQLPSSATNAADNVVLELGC